MKSSLKLLLFSLSLFLTATSAIVKVAARDLSENLVSSQLLLQPEKRFEIAQTQQSREIRAFFNSKYDYWDARVLAGYWTHSIVESKARIGRKVLWGETSVAVLEQYLVDARVAALKSPVQSILNFYSESKYTYADAEKLAKFWGDPSPYDAKVRIGRNLILGQEEVVDKAMQQASR
ncbi:MAG: hypothetical protein AB4426_29645 [Xenococcaceae cyanobacterium]